MSFSLTKEGTIHVSAEETEVPEPVLFSLMAVLLRDQLAPL